MGRVGWLLVSMVREWVVWIRLLVSMVREWVEWIRVVSERDQ